MACMDMLKTGNGGGGSTESELVYLGTHVGYSGNAGYNTSDGLSATESKPYMDPDYDLNIARYVGGNESIYPPHSFGISVTAKKACQVIATSVRNNDFDNRYVEIANMSAGETRAFKYMNANSATYVNGDYVFISLVVAE